MIRAQHIDKDFIVNILVSSFDSNKSINYIIRHNSIRIERIKRLILYSNDVCNLFGEIFLTE